MQKLILPVLISLISVPVFAVNTPQSPAPHPRTAAPKTEKVTPSAVPPGFRSAEPAVSFDPSKFGTITTTTLPTENGKQLVAKVNGRPVTWEDFEVQFEIAGAGVIQEHQGQRSGVMAALATPVLDALIMQQLYREFAETHNLKVQPGEVDRKRSELSGNPEGPIEAALRKLTPEQLNGYLTDNLIREKVDKFIGDQGTSVPPSTEEIRSYTASIEATTSPVELLRARHIVIRATPDMSEFNVKDAEAKAREALEKIRGGMDFAAAARQYSQDRFTAYLGGNIGYFIKGSMYPEFDKAAFALKPGEVSEVVRTPVGFHIIQVTERHADDLRLYLDKLRRFNAIEAWKTKARQSAKVERYLAP